MSQKQSSLESIAWVERLPDAGGAWGKGLVETVATMEAEAEKLEQVAAEATEKAKARRRLAVQTAKRASKEAGALFSTKVIMAAQTEPLTKAVESVEEPASA